MGKFGHVFAPAVHRRVAGSFSVRRCGIFCRDMKLHFIVRRGQILPRLTVRIPRMMKNVGVQNVKKGKDMIRKLARNHFMVENK